jgi:hypothetical protein
MGQTATNFNYVFCDGPNCKKAVNIEISNPDSTAKTLADNPWLKSPRGVTAGTKRVMTPQGPQDVPQQFLFCSDVCLVEAATAGMFISEIEKKIIAPEGNADQAIKNAAAQSAAVAAADKALRNGEGARIQVAQR